jgi:protein transport protein SEC24
MSLQKNAAFRGGGEIRPDERSFIWSQLANMSVDLSRCFIYPRMFSIHDMPPDAGTPATDGGADVSLQLLISLTYMNAFN